MQTRRTAKTHMQTSLRGIANRARKDQAAQFGDLSGLLSVQNLHWCFHQYTEEPNEAFEFLGFEFRWVRSHRGKMWVRRRTSPKKLRASIEAFTEWIKKNRHLPIKIIMRKVAQKLRGYWNYYGVIGNMKSLSVLNRACTKLLFKWLNRRSQRRSYNWAGFNKMCEHFRMPAPRIVETINRQQEFRWTASAR